MIKQYKYDTKSGCYTNKTEILSIIDYVKIFCNRTYNWKINFIRTEDLKDWAKEHGLNTEGCAFKNDILDLIFKTLSEEELCVFCDDLGIGITKYNYLAAGMTEKEYSRIYKKLTVVGRETISGRQFKNLYSIKEYIDYFMGAN